MTLELWDYLQWSKSTLSLHEFWERKAALSRTMAASPAVIDNPVARQWFQTSVLVVEAQQHFNWRVCLLMLLRTRAAGAL